jgi:F1F0 ATPase subunit 2
MMNETLTLILAGAAGVVLGAVFFAGLWWTVRRGVASPQPALWFLGSALVRTAVALAGFYFIADGRWQRLLVCLLGFLVARMLVMRLVPGAARAHPATRENDPLQTVSGTSPYHPKKL